MKTLKESILSSTKSGKAAVEGKEFDKELIALRKVNDNMNLRRRKYNQDMLGNTLHIGDLIYITGERKYGIIFAFYTNGGCSMGVYQGHSTDLYDNEFKERIIKGELSKNDILSNSRYYDCALHISYVSPDGVILVKPKKEVNVNTINSLQ